MSNSLLLSLKPTQTARTVVLALKPKSKKNSSVVASVSAMGFFSIRIGILTMNSCRVCSMKVTSRFSIGTRSRYFIVKSRMLNLMDTQTSSN